MLSSPWLRLLINTCSDFVKEMHARFMEYGHLYTANAKEWLTSPPPPPPPPLPPGGGPPPGPRAFCAPFAGVAVTGCWPFSSALMSSARCKYSLNCKGQNRMKQNMTCCAAEAALYNTAPHLERNCFLRPGILFILQVRLEVF
jgi:hypothetical protein